ncbi:dihydrodipicolinate synthase family protein [Kribbella sandramycini]|uniref:4-hydroxy-tetrahydrodipicolinate synthase n=1 Tax=Kribbella sandramycini TaxID=60450 RepID=A0A7Y4KWU1_9ACTN|nr:dihydrodipicolinate synthase family protein [Kribbella sandramycini]MBB6568256.1 4-hydroxy-tetrahydrodipicolinate synthase [Kribbella sandramycini]NOL39151.1 dihydrodipicolinate synthase family protein [Kribbella sandramycini]
MATTEIGSERPTDDVALLVRGVSPVLEVPFTADGEVDYAGFHRVVRYVLGTGVSSVMFPGFASEFHKLAEDERSALTEILLSYTRERPDVAAVIAVQDHATRLAAQRAMESVAAGADLINLLPPHFLAPSRRALADHVRTVLTAIAPAPMVLQYAPSETGTSLDAELLRSIAADHPNLRLVKVESSPPGPLIADLAAGTPALPSLEGYAGVQLPDAIRRGAVGTQPGCSLTEIYVEIWRRFATGDEAGGDELHRRLLPYISYWMLDTERIIAAEKLISVRRGLFSSAYCREPAHHLDAEEVRMVDRVLAEFAEFLPPLG